MVCAVGSLEDLYTSLPRSYELEKIVSEIIAFNSSRDGSSLKNRIKSIHTK